MKPFLVAAWTKKQSRSAADALEDAVEIVLPLTLVIAKDEKHATLIAARSIAPSVDLSSVEVAARPF